jgi:hypothetical protein
MSIQLANERSVLKINFFFVLLLILATPSIAQEYVWHKQMMGSGTNYSEGNDVVVDPSGNSYVVGDFGGTINFGGTSLTASSPTGDIFFTKYNTAGSLVSVTKISTVSGTFGDCTALDAATLRVGSDDFLYVVGVIGSANGAILQFDFNPWQTGGNLTMSDTNGDIFVAKYNVTGATPSFVWASIVPNTSKSDRVAVAVDATGNAYLGHIRSSGALLTKFDVAGAMAWSNTIGTPGSLANDVAVRGTNIYVGGSGLTASNKPIAWYNSSGTLVGSAGNSIRNVRSLSLDGGTGIYVAGQRDPSGNTNETSIEKYTTTNSSTAVWERFFSSGLTGHKIDIAVGTTSDLLVTYWFKGAINVNNGGTWPVLITSSGGGTQDNILVSRYSISTGDASWARNNPSDVSTGFSAPIAIATSMSAVHVAGFVHNRTIDVALCGTPVNVGGSSNSNTYLAKYLTNEVIPTFIAVNDIDCPEYVFSTNLFTGYTYDWQYYELPSGAPVSINNVGYQQKIILQNNKSYAVGVNINSSCGAATWYWTSINTDCDSGGDHLTVYPNPVTETLFVSSREGQEVVSFSIFDSQGMPITKNKIIENDGIDVSSLPKGVYYAVITSEKRSSRHRFMKN